MNDKDFDKLIAESFERDRMLESINRSVMKEINRTERKTLLHRGSSLWAWRLAFRWWA